MRRSSVFQLVRDFSQRRGEHTTDRDEQAHILSVIRLYVHLRRRGSTSFLRSLGRRFSTIIPSNSRHHPRIFHQSDSLILPHGYYKKHRRPTSTGSDRAMQACQRHARAYFGHDRDMYRDGSSCFTWWVEELSKRTQQFCIQWAWIFGFVRTPSPSPPPPTHTSINIFARTRCIYLWNNHWEKNKN